MLCHDRYYNLMKQGQGNDQKYEDSYFLFQINDTNNKAPIFVNRENPSIGKIEFSVQEEQAVGEEVGILLAHDGDSNPLFNKVRVLYTVYDLGLSIGRTM